MPTVKQREYLLSVDDFNNPQIVEGKSAIALLLSRLILLEPGSDPLHPEMGVGIRQYRFNNSSNVVNIIQDHIQSQVETYLPSYQGAEVEVSLGNDKILNVNITVGDTTYVYTSEVDNEDSTLNEVKNN